MFFLQSESPAAPLARLLSRQVIPPIQNISPDMMNDGAENVFQRQHPPYTRAAVLGWQRSPFLKMQVSYASWTWESVSARGLLLHKEEDVFSYLR